MTTYVDQLTDALATDERTRRVLNVSHVASSEELLSLLWNFPGLAVEEQIDAAGVSFLASQGAGRLAMDLHAAGLDPGAVMVFPTGASHAEGAGWSPGEKLGLDTAEQIHRDAADVAGEPVDKLEQLPVPWPIRDQGLRGTCVAFAATALVEHREMIQGGGAGDLSEQFLYWAIKVGIGDPWPTSDGTTLEFARDALAHFGICTEARWPYSGTLMPGNVSHQTPTDPSPGAKADAAGRTVAVVRSLGQPGGNAAALLEELRACRPVAISLPVFRDAIQPARHNWNSSVGVLYGKVLDPPPTAVVDGGHAVCVVGFVPDLNEPTGGHFVIRNSWGRGWGRSLPAAGYAAHAPGYGQVSATYVDRFLWEMCRL
jgi:hypothetical protein